MRKQAVVVAMVALLLPVMSLSAEAENKSGSGEKSAFSLESSSIEDGAEGIDVNQEIKLTFSKNVNNLSVVEDNKACFDIQNIATGDSVLEEVITYDDQLDRDNRNHMVLEAELEEAKLYEIRISENMKSKSGQTLGEPVTIQFATTGATLPKEQNPWVSRIMSLGIGMILASFCILMAKRNKRARNA